jgi:hypothetical protein
MRPSGGQCNEMKADRFDERDRLPFTGWRRRHAK